MFCIADFYLLFCRQTEYQKWLESGGSDASISCQNRTKLLICMDYFPPCESGFNYAAYPCKSTCMDYYELAFFVINSIAFVIVLLLPIFVLLMVLIIMPQKLAMVFIHFRIMPFIVALWNPRIFFRIPYILLLWIEVVV